MPGSGRAACPATSADCYTEVACGGAEPGTCREVTELSSAAIQNTVNISSDGDTVLLPSGTGDWSADADTVLITGTHDGNAGALELSDSTQSWITDQWVGEELSNVPDGSSCTIVASTATTMTCQWGSLNGGTNNHWQVGDTYEVRNQGVKWADKRIRVLGAGMDQTIIVGDDTKFRVQADTQASFRISGMTLSGGTQNNAFLFKNSTNTPTSGFRVDHIHFDYSEDTATDFFIVSGLDYGVIDHCTDD
jgi:hypothetical protein